MTTEHDLPGLWENNELHELKDMFERARERWQVVRRRHAIGSNEEVRAWSTYRTASVPYWALIHRT